MDKKLITIFLVVGLMLISACVSWATPTVNPPPGAPDWWNVECDYYAYGYWEDDIIWGGSNVLPPNNDTHWASNFLTNTDFKVSVGAVVAVVQLDNEFRPLPWKKEIFIYIEGTTTSGVVPTLNYFGTDGGTFTGSTVGSNTSGKWTCVVNGEIIPQPSKVYLAFYVPGLTKVTNIWAGENCVPEPATVALLGLGGLALLRRKRAN